jgi:hypothetical protein
VSFSDDRSPGVTKSAASDAAQIERARRFLAKIDATVFAGAAFHADAEHAGRIARIVARLLPDG